MASETEGQQLIVFRNDVVKPQNQQKVLPDHIPPQQDPNMLSIRRSGLTQVPEGVLDRGFLTYLCLEGNRISSLPGPLFLLLDRLQWLDLRNNLILSLPAELGSHRYLETLLLGGNPVSELPAELGNVSSLRGLDVRDCPIHFPPQDVVQQGWKAILQYLRSVVAQRPVTSTKTLAAVEKLRLSQLMESEDELEDGHGLRRFRELRDKLVPLDRAESDPTTQEAKSPTPQLPSVLRRKKASAKAGTSPACQDWRAAEGKFQMTEKELRNRQLQLEQRRKGQKTLPKERGPTRRRTREKKETEPKKKTPEEDPEDTRTNSQGQISLSTGSDEDRSARELQRHIRTCVERIQEKHRNLRASVSEKEDVEEIRRSQARLLEGQKASGRHLENSFIITADNWRRVPSKTPDK